MNNQLIFSFTLLTVFTNASVYAQKTERPNVVFIYADDMGRGMLSHYGQQYISTPNIDRLFREGTSFSYAYGCMFSAPARASMLTGYHDCRTDKWNISGAGLFVNAGTEEDIAEKEIKLNAERVRLPEGDLLLPQVFKQAGYVTAEIGKLEWGFTATRQQMREHGWDYYYGYLDHQRCHGFYPPFLFENDSVVYIEGNTYANCAKAYESETPENYSKRWDMTGKAVYSQNLFLEKIIRFIRQHKDEPFFLFHPTQLPHGPVSIPEVHPEVKDNPALTEIEKEYASMVKMLDDHIGIIMAELDQLGLLENTLFIFSVDNGHEIYYENGNRCRKSPVRDMDGKSFDSWDYPFRSDWAGDRFDGNNGMSGKKWTNWEGGVRVPLVFRWLGKIATGKTSDQLVANYDLLPTIAELLDVKMPVRKDGESLLPILTEGKDTIPEQRYVFFSSDEGPAVVRSDGWKLRYHKGKKAFRLYYLPDDYEERNAIDNVPEVFETLKNKLTEETGNEFYTDK